MISLDNFRIQYGVGQGSFHAASVSIAPLGKPVTKINYVYDCGAANVGRATSQLKRAVSHFIMGLDERKVDFLVISHLDADHVNGAEMLCKQATVDRIFLPYLTNEYALILIAQSLASGTGAVELTSLASSLAEVLTNGSLWGTPVTLVERGIRGEIAPGSEFQISADQAEGELLLRAADGSFRRLGGNASDDDELIGVRDGRLVWRFKFWNYKHEDALSSGLPQKLIEELIARGVIQDPLFNMSNAADLMTLITEILKSPEKKKQTNAAYSSALASIAIDTNADDVPNLTSLCLLSAPPEEAIRRSVSPWGRWWWHFDDEYLGWLGTGDAPLGDPAVIQDFMNHYRDDIDKLDTLVVPHHGAAPKSSPAFFHPGLLGSAHWAVISAGSKNSYGHPRPSVLHEIMKFGAIPEVVTELSWPGFVQAGRAELP